MATPQFAQFQSKTPNPEVPNVFDVTPEEVLKLKERIKVIDVRRPDEWVGEFGHIDTAELVTLNTIPARIHQLPKDCSIVFVCRSGARSAQAAAFALENGFTEVFNMKGGMIAWRQNNFDSIERNGGSIG